MKRRFLVGIATLAVAAMTLTGCGKTPTLEDIRDNLGHKDATSGIVEGNLSFDVSVEIDDISDDLEMLLDYLEESEGIDLSDGLEANVDVSVKATMESDGNVQHSTAEGSIDFDCSIDELQEAIEDGIDETEFSSEKYIDRDEELVYDYTSDEDEWYVDEYDDDDDDDDAADEALEAFQTMFDLAIDFNESADKKDQIKVVKDGNEYVVAGSFTFDNDFAENIDKNEKKKMQKAFDDLEMDIDLDDVLEMFETYGEYAEISIPVSLEFRFVQDGKGKDAQYLISGVKFEISGSISCDFDEDEVADLLEEAGAPTDGMDVSCSFAASAKISLSVEASVGYDKVDEVEIPKKVKKDAIELY